MINHLLFALILMCCFGALASERTVDDEIYHALKIRSTNPIEFNKTLTSIEGKNKNLTSSQRSYLEHLKGLKYFFEGDLKRSVDINEGLLLKNIDNELRFLVHTSLANLYAYLRDMPQGLESVNYIKSNIDIIEDDYYQILGYVVISIFHNQLGLYEEGLKYSTLALSKEPAGWQKCMASSLSIESKSKLKESPISDKEIEASLYNCRSTGQKTASLLMQLHHSESILYSHPRKVISDMEAIYNDLIDLNNAPAILGAEYILAVAYFNAGHFARSKYFSLSLLEQWDGTVRLYKYKMEVLRVLYLMAKDSGNYKLAIDYYEEFVKIKELYHEDNKNNKLSYELALYKIVDVEKENKTLADQNSLLKLRQKLTQSEKENQQLFIVLLGTCLILLTAYLYKARQNQIRLKQLAEFDALTGVHNRGHFTQLAKSALQFAQDSKQSVAVVLFDLDLFKKVNDTYGHACGDWVLKHVAGVCQELTRKNDVFARVGGEEFCFLLLGCDSHTALDVAEKCRRAIYGIDTRKSGFDFKVSGSFGVSDVQLSGYELDRILADADEALYCSKSSGRNTVSLYDPGAEQTALLRPDGSPAT